MTLRVDFSEVQDFDLIKEGNYRAIITGQEIRESKSSEFPYINWTYTFVGSEYDNRKAWLMTSLSPKALFRLKAFLIAGGETKESLSESFELDPEKYIGMEMTIQIKHEVDSRDPDGKKMQDRIGEVYAAGSIAEGPKDAAPEPKGKKEPVAAATKSGAKRL